jgi:hypothetical protein
VVADFIVGPSKEEIFKFLTDFDNTALFEINECEDGTDEHFGSLSITPIDNRVNTPYEIIAENPTNLSEAEKAKLLSYFIDGNFLPFFLGVRDDMRAYKEDWMDE